MNPALSHAEVQTMNSLTTSSARRRVHLRLREHFTILSPKMMGTLSRNLSMDEYPNSAGCGLGCTWKLNTLSHTAASGVAGASLLQIKITLPAVVARDYILLSPIYRSSRFGPELYYAPLFRYYESPNPILMSLVPVSRAVPVEMRALPHFECAPIGH